MQATNCESCVNYVYDEDYECYTCLVNLDEDEMYRFVNGTSHDHHFKWWFEISPIRALLQARPKGRISQANYRLPLKEVIYAYLLAWFLLPVRQYTF